MESNEFIDSPEWFAADNNAYKVTVVALRESKVVIWNRDVLRYALRHDEALLAILEHILGKDVGGTKLRIARDNEILKKKCKEAAADINSHKSRVGLLKSTDCLPAADANAAQQRGPSASSKQDLVKKP